MAAVNKVILIGNLGADPEVRFSNGGTPIANFNMATTEKFTSKAGERTEKTEWHRIVVFGRTAEVCKQYLTKGSTVYIEGRLQTRDWTDKSGQKRYTTEIVCNTMQMLGGRGGGAGGGGGMSTAQRSGGGFEDDMSMAGGPPPMDDMAGGGGFPSDDDIPF